MLLSFISGFLLFSLEQLPTISFVTLVVAAALGPVVFRKTATSPKCSKQKQKSMRVPRKIILKKYIKGRGR